MKVLLDHNVPRKLRRALFGHEVLTADEMGWARLSNGSLLLAAEASAFDVMITGDKNISYQQSLHTRQIAIILLSNADWPTLRQTAVAVSIALDRVRELHFQLVDTNSAK